MTPWCARTIPRTTGRPSPRPVNLLEKKRVEELFNIRVRDPAARVRHFEACMGIVLGLPVGGKTVYCGNIRR